ncbi:MAG: hypothetical protein SGILL_005909 [Bacillariaceae sp.]
MPILGMGMMQFAGGLRNVAIIDFQPLLSDDGDDQDNEASQRRQGLYTSTLEQIRSKADPALQQPMSNRHFDPNDNMYFTANPIIGKWSNSKSDDDATEAAASTAAKRLERELRTTHQDCVRAHVELTQATTTRFDDCAISDRAVRQLHSDYDTFVAAKEPASQLLSGAFGKDVAQRLVHQVIFPLSSHR